MFTSKCSHSFSDSIGSKCDCPINLTTCHGFPYNADFKGVKKTCFWCFLSIAENTLILYRYCIDIYTICCIVTICGVMYRFYTLINKAKKCVAECLFCDIKNMLIYIVFLIV